MTAVSPSHRLPTWVAQLRSDRHRSGVVVAIDVADAVLALTEPEVPASVRWRLAAIVERADEVTQGVPVSVAAKVLDVTEPTVRAWIGRGVLAAVHQSRPVAVTPRSLGEALAASSTIRRVGQDERLLRRLLDVMDDQRTRLELVGRIDELASRVRIDPDRIENQLFGGRTSHSA